MSDEKKTLQERFAAAMEETWGTAITAAETMDGVVEDPAAWRSPSDHSHELGNAYVDQFDEISEEQLRHILEETWKIQFIAEETRRRLTPPVFTVSTDLGGPNVLKPQGSADHGKLKPFYGIPDRPVRSCHTVDLTRLQKLSFAADMYRASSGSYRAPEKVVNRLEWARIESAVRQARQDPAVNGFFALLESKADLVLVRLELLEVMIRISVDDPDTAVPVALFGRGDFEPYPGTLLYRAIHPDGLRKRLGLSETPIRLRWRRPRMETHQHPQKEYAMTPDQLKMILSAHEAWLRDEDGGERAVLTGADLRGADLSGANLRCANLTEADLTIADLTGANLRCVNLYGARLADAVLTGADLYGAGLRGANLTGADLSDADLSDADLTDANLTGADLRGADLESAFLTGADLRGADLRGAFLTGADLAGADLRETDLRAEQHAEDVRHAALRSNQREQDRVPSYLKIAREALSAAANDIDTTLDSLRGDLVDLTVQAEGGLGHPQSVEPHAPFGVDYAADLVNFLKTADERIRAFRHELMGQAPDWRKYDTRQLTEADPKKVKSDHPLAEGNWDHWMK